MKKLNLCRSASLVFGMALALPFPLRAQHGHLNAGASGVQQNAQLIWANGAEFIASSGYVKTLDFTNSGRFAGYYQGGITPTALPATSANAGPDPQASALGSVLQFSMACLSGPEGGTFNFWEATGATPALSLAPGQSSTNLFRLSQNDGAPGTDPYGHIHGRRFSATKAGLYTVAFRAVDTSTNGSAGGPIHTPSVALPVWFQAGVNVAAIEPDYDEGHVHVKFAAPTNTTWQVEAATQLGTNANWQPIGTPILGTDVFRETMLEMPPGPKSFYRLRRTAP